MLEIVRKEWKGKQKYLNFRREDGESGGRSLNYFGGSRKSRAAATVVQCAQRGGQQPPCGTDRTCHIIPFFRVPTSAHGYD